MLSFPWEGQPLVAAFGALFFVLLAVIFVRKSRRARHEKAQIGAPEGTGADAWENVMVALMYTIIGILTMLFGVYFLVPATIMALPIVILAMRKEAKENKATQAYPDQQDPS